MNTYDAIELLKKRRVELPPGEPEREAINRVLAALRPSERASDTLVDLSALAQKIRRTIGPDYVEYDRILLDVEGGLITFKGEYWSHGSTDHYHEDIPIRMLDDADGGTTALRKIAADRQEDARKRKEEDARKNAITAEQRERELLAQLKRKYE